MKTRLEVKPGAIEVEHDGYWVNLYCDDGYEPVDFALNHTQADWLINALETAKKLRIEYENSSGNQSLG